MTTKTDTARDQAKAQLDHITQLMEWLEHANECDGNGVCGTSSHLFLPDGYENQDASDPETATQAIHESALSVLVREDWHTPGEHDVTSPTEFEILLCNGEPDRAWLEYQDWGTPWTEYFDSTGRSGLLNYAQQFYFGA